MVKTGKKVYSEYVNPRPQVDLVVQAEETCAPPDFASLFVPVDTRLHALERELSVQDSYPQDAWFDGFVQRHPWLSSLTAVNTSGEILFQKQTDRQDRLAYGSLISGEWKTRHPRAVIAENGPGTRLCLIMPFFKNNVWKGCLVAAFVPEDLVEFSPESASLVLLDSTKHVLWAGNYADRIDVLADHPWEELLAEQVSGEIDADGEHFFWLGRSFAGTWLIYASPVHEGR